MSSSSRPNPVKGLIVCGPCACGKSEVASALAQHYQVPFVDADSYHSESNILKMSSGIPLTDDDRLPWLSTVRQQIILQKKVSSPSTPTHNDEDLSQLAQVQQQVGVVAACSALTQKYRNILRGNGGNGSTEESELPKQEEEGISIIFVFLNCSESVLQKRLNNRQGHFMKAGMLSSQLATLEVPNEEAVQGHAIIVDGDAELPSVLQEATEKLQILLTSTSSSSS